MLDLGLVCSHPRSPTLSSSFSIFLALLVAKERTLRPWLLSAWALASSNMVLKASAVLWVLPVSLASRKRPLPWLTTDVVMPGTCLVICCWWHLLVGDLYPGHRLDVMALNRKCYTTIDGRLHPKTNWGIFLSRTSLVLPGVRYTRVLRSAWCLAANASQKCGAGERFCGWAGLVSMMMGLGSSTGYPVAEVHMF